MVERIPPYRPTSEFWAKQMTDPAFAEALKEMEPEFQVAREILRLRLKRGLSQKELAARVGTQQSGISRLERADAKPSLSLLQRVAKALNAHLEIRFVPDEERG